MVLQVITTVINDTEKVQIVDLCFLLQMEVNAVEKRHRTRSKGVRGKNLAFLCFFINLA